MESRSKTPLRAHQILIPVDQNDMQHADALVEWLESYRPEELFDKKVL